ncbi:cell wall hydrolase [Salinarimonas rosea]|uniref:cell wall hydrolase n=1 Tax=Salinarimonas rosea TaxID=552063 RepID=UPI0004219FA6|nr:cell wall hydrolase [Salinarimonas rosea]
MRLRRRPRKIDRMRWVCATAAPWALGAGLLVSFTATAGVNIEVGRSIETPRPAERLAALDHLVAPAAPDLAGRLSLAVEASAIRFTAHGLAARAAAPRDGDVPRMQDKPVAEGDVPARANRAAKGDAEGAVPVSLGRIGRTLEAQSSSLLGPDAARFPAERLAHGEAMPILVVTAGVFERREETATEIATAALSPAAAAQGSTGRGLARGIAQAREGATPGVARAASLASSTPTARTWSPVEVAAAPVSLPPAVMAGAPRFLDLVDPAKLARERRCLEQAVYFEARSEPEEGQAAVAQVVLNRVKSSLYPSTICGVVFQNSHRHLACQFTFTCEGKSLRITEPAAWDRARRIAAAVLEGETYLADVGNATHYHADYVRPRWASRLRRADTIGRHIFYQLRPGQR